MKYEKWNKTLTIGEHGAYIYKNLDYIIVKINGNKTRFLSRDLKKITIMNSFSITKGAIMLCMFNKIRIMALSSHGSPLFTILPLRVEDGFLQLLMKRLDMTEYQRTALSKYFVENTIKGKLAFVRYKKSIFKRTDKKKEKVLSLAEIKIMEQWKALKKIRGRWTAQKQNLLEIESHAANIYFSCFKEIFDIKIYKGKRDKNGGDLVNMCLNYAYGVLKYHMFHTLLDNGINPFDSVYHFQEGKTKMFLVFDCMEGLRHTVCDWAVHGLINLGKIKNRDIETEGENKFLSLEKRKLIVQEVERRLELKKHITKKTLKKLSRFK